MGKGIAFLFMLLLRSFAVTIGLPLFIFAVILFYVLESGLLEIDFLPGNATFCWWLIFSARQCVTLDVARIVQWILVDYIALSSKIAVRIFGPLLTLVAIQSHGWPFLATWWSLLDLIFLYGNNKFQQNWFHAYELATFAEDESGGNAILVSETYLRLLLSVLVAGLAATIKRTSLAMYFGQKTVGKHNAFCNICSLCCEPGILVTHICNNCSQFTTATVWKSFLRIFRLLQKWHNWRTKQARLRKQR
jgi:hypothetical protein